MIGTGRTAVVILDRVQLTNDDVVVVTAAAGGIGSLLVQASRNAGRPWWPQWAGRSRSLRTWAHGADIVVD